LERYCTAATHSSSGCQPNFAALNRGHHQYSAGRPWRWALAHILVTARVVVAIIAVTMTITVNHLYFFIWSCTNVHFIIIVIIGTLAGFDCREVFGSLPPADERALPCSSSETGCAIGATAG